MSDQSEIPEAEQLEEIPTIRNFDVVCRIKKSSKYYRQGLVNPEDPNSKARFFKLEHFTPLGRIGLALCRDGYALHFNGNAYRLEDVEVFLLDPGNIKNFVRVV